MNSFLTLLLGAVLLIVGIDHVRAATFFVATNGNDGWTGRLERPNRNGTDGPLTTLPAAINAARAARRQRSSEAITIFLRGGTYALNEPLTLLPEDSGFDAEHPFVIAAYRGEKATISGGRRIFGWKRVEGTNGLWEVEIPEVREGKWYFHQLFVNGHRAQRARTPNDGFFRIQGASPQDKPVKLHFTPGDIKRAWASDGDVEVVAFFAWSDLRMQIREVDELNDVATLSGNARSSNKENNARYCIENAADALEQPGEWHLNRQSGVLTYWARPGEDLTKAAVIAPRLPNLMLMRG